MAGPYTLSIEYAPMQSFREGYHQGNDEQYARNECVTRFRARLNFGLPVHTIGLIDGDGCLVDTYDGTRWSSDVI